MSYVKSVLQPGETVVASGRLHWIIYGWAIFFLITGATLVWWLHVRWPNQDRIIAAAAVTFGALFLFTFLRAWFIRWITEFAVTNRRVISKRGFISRATAEMNMDKVESVDINQSVPGRILGYGTIRVVGTGGINIKKDNPEENNPGIIVRRIAAPFQLRSAITAK